MVQPRGITGPSARIPGGATDPTPQTSQRAQPHTGQNARAGSPDLMAALGLNPDGTLADVSTVNKSQGVQSTQASQSAYGKGAGRIAPPTVRSRRLNTAKDPIEVESLARDSKALVGTAVDAAQERSAGTKRGDFGGDLALAALKLRITNALNDPETLNLLLEANDELSELANESYKALSLRAEEEKNAAEKEAKKGKYGKAVLSVAVIVASVALTVCSFGATAALVVGACILAGALIGGAVAAAKGKSMFDGALMGASIGAAVGSLAVGGAALAGAQWAQQGLLAASTAQAVGAGVSIAGGVANAEMAREQYQAQMKLLDAQAMEVRAEVLQKLMELLQASSEDIQRFMMLMLEMVNQSFDNAVNSITASGEAMSNLISAGSGR